MLHFPGGQGGVRAVIILQVAGKGGWLNRGWKVRGYIDRKIVSVLQDEKSSWKMGLGDGMRRSCGRWIPNVRDD